MRATAFEFISGEIFRGVWGNFEIADIEISGEYVGIMPKNKCNVANVEVDTLLCPICCFSSFVVTSVLEIDKKDVRPCKTIDCISL